MRKKKNTPTMPVDPADYIADTRHLSLIEHGAYWLLMLHYWQNKGLPTDERAIARITGMTPEQWAESRDALYALFKLGNWKQKRIEEDLGVTARASAAGRRGGLVSGQSRRKKSQLKQQHRTIVQRSANDPPTKREALKKVSKEERTLDPRGSNDAGASLRRPVYTDSKHELWGEGVPILVQLGMTDATARSNIGRWLKDSKEDAVGVLGAIQRAREHRVIDPVPWITRALKPGSKADVAESRSLVAAGRRAAASLARAPDLGDGASEPLLRLLPQS